MYDFNMLVAPFLSCLSWLCMFTCLFTCLFSFVTKPHSRVGFRGVCTRPYTQNPRPTFRSLLVDTCVFHNLIQWIYWHNPNLHLLHMSLCLFTSMFSSLCCLFVCHVLLVLCDVLFLYIACGGWSMHPTSKRQAKGHWSVNIRGLAPLRGLFFP